MTITLPTNFPAGDRRTVRVTGITAARPTTVSAVFRAAARLLAANGLHQGDYVDDVFDRKQQTAHALRPMCIVAALRCAVSGSPHVVKPLADEALEFLAPRLLVGGSGPYDEGDPMALEYHLAAWGDVEGRTTESVCAVLAAAADASEVSA